jgi:hypothetical protein
MAKYVNTTTGATVPADEVVELSPGSGILIQRATVATKRLETPAGGRGTVPTPFGPANAESRFVDATQVVVTGFVVKLADNETYDPVTHNVISQVLAVQNAARNSAAPKDGAK